MKDAIKFLYTGEVHVNMERVKDLLEVADYLQISEMIEICVTHLKGITLNLANCVQILLLSSLHNLGTYDAAFKFVSGHLPELMAGNDLMDFTKTSLLTLVSDPTLSYVKREDFYNFIIRWTEYDLPNRQKEFEELFCSLDLLSILPAVFADKIEQHPLVARSEKCQIYCIEKKLKGMVGATACAPQMQDVILLGGGTLKDNRYRFLYLSRNASMSLFAFLVRQERWVRLPDLPYGISKPLMAVTEEGDLLVIDSYMMDDADKQKQLLKFCPFSNTWSCTKLILPDTETDFTVHAMLAIGSRVFFVASSKSRLPTPPSRLNQNNQHKTPPPQTLVHWHVQLFELNKENGVLSNVCSFFQRAGNSEVNVTCQQAVNSRTLDGPVIYVMGSKVMPFRAKGKALMAKGKNKCNKFFVYELQTNRAREIHSKMAFEPLAFGMTDGFLSGRLGKVNHKFFNQSDRRMIYSNNYTIKLPPKDPSRQDFAVTAVNDEVYLFGGKLGTGAEASTSAAKFSFATQTWTELPDLPTSFIGSAIARGRMSLDALRCHLDCPHCFYRPLKERTTYNVPFSYRERVDSPARYYDMDYSDGSDDDDYYDYDDIEPSYSDDGWGPYLDPDEYDLYDIF